jgi:DNA-binding GntR family transcriptional regulator
MSDAVQRVPDLRQQVYERLRRRLRTGVYAPDIRLGEVSVAEEFGVSRTPAREALAMLVREGLLIREGRSFSLPPFNAKELFDVFEVRLCLEPYAVSKIAENAADEDLLALKEMIYEQQLESLPWAEYVEVRNRVWHFLFDLLENERLRNVIYLYNDYAQYNRTRTLRDPMNRANSVAGWRRLGDAIATRDTAAANLASRNLLIMARDAMEKVLKEEGAREAEVAEEST